MLKEGSLEPKPNPEYVVRYFDGLQGDQREETISALRSLSEKFYRSGLCGDRIIVEKIYPFEESPDDCLVVAKAPNPYLKAGLVTFLREGMKVYHDAVNGLSESARNDISKREEIFNQIFPPVILG